LTTIVAEAIPITAKKRAYIRVKSDPSVSIKDRDQEVVTDDVTLPVIEKTLGNDHSPTG
jgi:hypothetical protein